jgi:hypothetical protein
LVTFTAHFLLCIGVTAFLAVACQLSSLQQPKEKEIRRRTLISLRLCAFLYWAGKMKDTFFSKSNYDMLTAGRVWSNL